MTLVRFTFTPLVAALMIASNCAARPFVYARLLEKLDPIDRGGLYEEPLNVALKQAGFGECDGGGTMQLKTGEIEALSIFFVDQPENAGI
jgi:hypothetical protein